MVLTKKAALLASAAILCATASAGQEVYDLDPIRVEDSDAQDTLGNRLITREEIEARNPSSMADVFDGESEVQSSGGAAIRRWPRSLRKWKEKWRAIFFTGGNKSEKATSWFPSMPTCLKNSCSKSICS